MVVMRTKKTRTTITTTCKTRRSALNLCMTSRQEHDGVNSAAVDVPSGSVRAWFALVAGAPAGGAVLHAHGAAIAAIGLGGEIDAAFSALSIRPVPVGGVALRSLAGIDTGLVARPTSGSAYLFPHAGPEIVRRLLKHCRDAGLVPMETLGEKDVSPTERWPEARDDHEARVLDALAGAPSPLAIDVLLAQLPERGRAGGFFDSDAAAGIRTSPRRHVLRPPVVAALGRRYREVHAAERPCGSFGRAGCRSAGHNS